MNVLLVNYEYPPLGGGAGNASMFIARALTEFGHQVTVLTSHFGDLPRRIIVDGITTYRVKAYRRWEDRSDPVQMATFMASAVRVARKVAREHEIHATVAFFTIPSAPVAWWLWRTMRVPYIVSLRGGDVPGLVPEIVHVHRLLAPFRRMLLRSAKAIVANSASLARRSHEADPYAVCVIPNGVDANFFRPDASRQGELGESFRILFVGRLHRQKNVDLLLRALASTPQESVRLDVVGNGAERPALEALARTLGVAHRVAWRGWQDKDAVAAFYRTSDCLVNPSAYEGMPNVVLEAMASGLPVIASNIEGNNELVRPDETGLLFDLPDELALRDCIAELIGDRKRCAEMGVQGRAVVMEEYSWTAVAKRYASLLLAHIAQASPTVGSSSEHASVRVSAEQASVCKSITERTAVGADCVDHQKG